MEKGQIARLHNNFEECVHTNDGIEFWYARELQILLGYDKRSNFENVVDKAKIACETAKQKVLDHFADVGKMVDLGSGGKREAVDVMLTRYALLSHRAKWRSKKRRNRLCHDLFRGVNPQTGSSGAAVGAVGALAGS